MVHYGSFCKGDNFFDFFLLSCTYTPFWKGVYSKRKEFAPKGSKFFPFRVEPFSKGRQNNVDRATSPENVLTPLKEYWYIPVKEWSL